MKRCDFCGKDTDGYETLISCPQCEDNGSPDGAELARKDAEIARLRAALGRCRRQLDKAMPGSLLTEDLARLCADALEGKG